MSRVEAEILGLRKSLDKALTNASGDGGVEVEVGEMMQALSEVEMTLELLRSTKIGVTVAAVKKRYPDAKIGNLAKDMIALWKELVPTKAAPAVQSGGSGSGSGSNSATASKLTTIGGAAAAAAAAAVIDISPTPSHADPRYEALPPPRKKIVDLLAEKLKMSATEANAIAAEFMACTIETGIHNMFDSDSDKANYATKARSLLHNLKNNENLRRNIIDGVLDAELVVHLTAAQLASEEKTKEAEKAKEDAVAERRGDWVRIQRDQIMRDNGLDPNKGGEFTCKKCKGTKTSHYSLQTRSADEPMTVFVCCLTCGNRWRTQ